MKRIAAPALTALLTLLLLLHGSPAAAQFDDGDSIFGRKDTKKAQPPTEAWLLEFPVILRPQTSPDARLVENVGFNYVRAETTRSQSYNSIGFHWSRSKWEPTDPNWERVNVTQFDTNVSINTKIGQSGVFHLGLGLGLLDGLTTTPGKGVHHTLELYVPLQTGYTFYLGERFLLGLRVLHTPDFSDGPVYGSTRVYLGFGARR